MFYTTTNCSYIPVFSCVVLRVEWTILRCRAVNVLVPHVRGDVLRVIGNDVLVLCHALSI